MEKVNVWKWLCGSLFTMILLVPPGLLALDQWMYHKITVESPWVIDRLGVLGALERNTAELEQIKEVLFLIVSQNEAANNRRRHAKDSILPRDATVRPGG